MKRRAELTISSSKGSNDERGEIARDVCSRWRTISSCAAAPYKKWLTFVEDFLCAMTLVSQLAQIDHHFSLDFIFQ